MKQFELSPSLKTAVLLAAIVIILAGIKSASLVLVPFLLSIFIAIICNPILKSLVKYRIPKALAITMIIVFVVLAGMSLAGLVGKAINGFSAQLPFYQAQLTERFAGFIELLASYDVPINTTTMMEYFDPSVAMTMATSLLNSLSGVMANFFLILLTVVFMLAESIFKYFVQTFLKSC